MHSPHLRQQPADLRRVTLSNGTVLVGTNKVRHIESAVKAALEGSLPGEILMRLRTLAISDPLQVDPKNWPATMVADAKDGKKVHDTTR